MAAQYSDPSISAMLVERKLLPSDYVARIALKNKRGHKERELDVTGAKGNQYRLILRENNINRLDFSIILALCPPMKSALFRLRRYNGKCHEHTNKLEHLTFYDFHIHTATERYQELGTREDAFAEVTNRYADIHGAFSCMLDDCGFEIRANPQGTLLF